MHLADSRRYAHVALLVLMIIGIRAFGGPTQAEDRLASFTRWTAEKAGLGGVKETLDAKVKPRVAEATGSMTYKLYAVSSEVMNGFEAAVNGTADWVWRQVWNAEQAIETRLRSTLSPNTPPQPQGPDAVPPEDNRNTVPPR